MLIDIITGSGVEEPLDTTPPVMQYPPSWGELVNGFNVTFTLNDASNMTTHLGVLKMCIGDQCYDYTSSDGYCWESDNLVRCSSNLVLEAGPGEYTLDVISEDMYGNGYNYTETRYFEAEP